MLQLLMPLTAIHYHLEFRSVVMGLALIAILMNHNGIDIACLQHVAGGGFLGVDAFAFVSGAGCYYSLSSCSNPIKFLQRRVLRLCPPYWLSYVVYFPIFKKYFFLPLDLVADLIFVMRLGAARPNWYYSGMWVYYLACLLFFPVVQCVHSAPKLVVYMAVLFVFAYGLSEDIVDQLIFCRLPILFAGLYFGKCTKESSSLGPQAYIPIFLMLPVGCHYMMRVFIKNDFYTVVPELWMTTSVTLTPGFVLIALNAAHLLSRSAFTRWIVFLLTKIGDCSFECLLVHIGCLNFQKVNPEIFPFYHILVCGHRIHQFYFNALITFIGAFLLRLAGSRLSHFLSPYLDKVVEGMLTDEDPSSPPTSTISTSAIKAVLVKAGKTLVGVTSKLFHRTGTSSSVV